MRLNEITKKEWDAYVFDKSFHVYYHGCIELEEMLMESKNLVYEDQQDVKEYKEFIAIEKSNSIQYDNLIQGKLYFPIQYRGAPFQQTIILDIPTIDCKFIKSDNTDLVLYVFVLRSLDRLLVHMYAMERLYLYLGDLVLCTL